MFYISSYFDNKLYGTFVGDAQRSYAVNTEGLGLTLTAETIGVEPHYNTGYNVSSLQA